MTHSVPTRRSADLDSRAPSVSRTDCRDHRNRSVEPGGRSTQEDRAALPLARRRHRTNRGSFASAGRKDVRGQIGRAHVCSPVTNAHLVCRLLLEKTKTTLKYLHLDTDNLYS